MTYKELKNRNKKAHSSLITLWEDLSRVSRSTARKDLKDDWGLRYNVIPKGETDLEFIDSHTGDVFTYNDSIKQWR